MAEHHEAELILQDRGIPKFCGSAWSGVGAQDRGLRLSRKL